jgi:hypothetical protein
MRTTITHAERLHVADWIRDARYLLADVAALERDIAITLGVPRDEESITDAISVPTCTVDDLLETLGISVSEDVP